jgi:amino acid transporter
MRRIHLFIAFAFTVMADPVSSVAYAIESTLRGLDGDLDSLLPTMAAVIAIIAVICATYDELIRRFPNGGGGPEGVAAAFGEGWAFIPLGALLVDFTLTVAVSCAAGASALIAYVPVLEPLRTPIGLALAGLVAAVVLLGQLGRVAFALATQLFIVLPRQARFRPMLRSDRFCWRFRSEWRSPPASKRPPTRSRSYRSSMTAPDAGSVAGPCG